MAHTLPYLASPGSITNALNKVKTAAKPPRFTNDFVKSKLQIKGGTGQQIAPFLKKIGLVGTDGAPTKLYDQFRNTQTSKAAIAAAIKHGYKKLYEVNEYAHELSEAELKSLMASVTGLGEGDKTVGLSKSTFLKLKAFADFDASLEAGKVDLGDKSDDDEQPGEQERPSVRGSGGLGLSYTINLNLPATTNVDVFNAIFKSLKNNLLDEL